MKVPGWLVPCIVFGGLIVFRILEVFAPKVLEQFIGSIFPLLFLLVILICLSGLVYWGWCLLKWFQEAKAKPGQIEADILCLVLLVQCGFMALATLGMFVMWFGNPGGYAAIVFFAVMGIAWYKLKRRDEARNWA